MQLEAVLVQLLAAVRAGGTFAPSSPAVGSAPLTLAELCNQFLEAKLNANRSDNYLDLLIKELRSFARGRESRPVVSISSTEIEDWLHGQLWSDRTKKGRLATIRTVFEWGVKRQYLAVNPAAGVDVPYVSTAPPGIHTPEQVRHVLETARAQDRTVMRVMAIRYFAGLRTSEAVALEESEIGAKFIEVTAAKSKTRRRRLVPVVPTLAAWLKLGGELPLRQVDARLRAIILAAAVPWPRGVTRHSFVTYHLAEHQNAGKTALIAGHSEQILFNHYRELATPETAKAFWSVLPTAKPSKARARAT